MGVADYYNYLKSCKSSHYKKQIKYSDWYIFVDGNIFIYNFATSYEESSTDVDLKYFLYIALKDKFLSNGQDPKKMYFFFDGKAPLAKEPTLNARKSNNDLKNYLNPEHPSFQLTYTSLISYLSEEFIKDGINIEKIKTAGEGEYKLVSTYKEKAYKESLPSLIYTSDTDVILMLQHINPLNCIVCINEKYKIEITKLFNPTKYDINIPLFCISVGNDYFKGLKELKKFNMNKKVKMFLDNKITTYEKLYYIFKENIKHKDTCNPESYINVVKWYIKYFNCINDTSPKNEFKTPCLDCIVKYINKNNISLF